MNMYQRITRIAAMLFLFAFVASCSDDEEEAREELIIGTWLLESQEVTNIKAEGLPLDLSTFLTDDNQEDLAILPENATITFNQDRTYSIDDPSQTGLLTGSWELSGNGDIITLGGLEAAEALLGTNTLPFTIQSINTSDLSLLASVSGIDISNFDIPNLPSSVANTKFSGDYQLDLKKQQ